MKGGLNRCIEWRMRLYLIIREVFRMGGRQRTSLFFTKEKKIEKSSEKSREISGSKPSGEKTK